MNRKSWLLARKSPAAPWRARPRVEDLEGRLTPSTLPPGFTETLVNTQGTLSSPTRMEFAPDGRLFVLEQGGNVKLIQSNGATWTALHLNVDPNGERGLLGIAFDPNYSTNHFVYLYYTNPNAGAAPWATGEHNQISRFTVNDSNPQQPVFGSEAPILDLNNLSSATNHNGGDIHFGKDGMLYADAGDNVQTFTLNGNTYRVSQTLANLLGKQLRIDVSKFNSGVAARDDTAVGHLIPADNPFVGTATGINQLIYVLGLRNPFSFAVQPGTGTMFINDVGENTWEEINQDVAGSNYGWSGGNTDGFGQTPPGPGPYRDPLMAYDHSNSPPSPAGTAITNGVFYPANGSFGSAYAGKYFFTDLGGRFIRIFDPAQPGSAANPDTSTAFASNLTTASPVGLLVDASGNLYYLAGAGGTGAVYRISAKSSSATFLKSDTTTQGNWTAAYGADGYNVIGGTTAYPSYAQVSASGQLSYTWADPTTDVRAPWKSAAMASRVAATWYSGSSFTIDLNITDGATHQVALYLLDWDGNGVRKERVDVLDAASGNVLDTETGSSFSGGDYLVWTIGGHVQFRITNLAGGGTNAVLSGLFFGTGTGGGGSGNGSATFLKSDTATQGNWTTAYGADGYNVIGGTTSYLSYAQVTPSGQSFYTWADPTTDMRAPWKSAAMISRVAATWYSGSSFTVDLNITDGATHQVALYLLDWDGNGVRKERIDVLDAASGKLLDTETGSSFSGGDYLVWTIGGHVQFQVTNLAGGGTNAVLSGLFFGTGGGGGGGGNGSATFLKSDTTTQGTWMGSYGADGYNVIDYATKYPSYASVAPGGQSDYVWSPSTTDPRALEKTGPNDRIAATWYSGTSFTIDLNVTDGATHQVALYLLDWDSGGLRDERIDVLDAVTGKVLDTETAKSFSGGDYLVWTIGGHVTFQLTNLAGPATNAVVSGLFFG